MIAVPDRWLAAGEVADGDRKAALELVIIVAVENVVLAIVLVVDDCLGRGEAVTEERFFGGALGAGAIGVAAPGEIGLGEIAIALPAALVDERLQSGAVGARFRAKDAVAGAAVRRLGRHALLLERGTIGGDARGQRVDGFGLVERGDRARRRVDEIDEIGEGVAKEAGDPQGDVDAWPVEDAGGQDLEAGDAAGPWLPLRAHAHQRQRLRDIVAAGPHAGRAPGRKREAARIDAMLLGMQLDEALRRLPAELPRRRRRHRARIDGIEVASGRQDIRPPAARRARRAGCDEAPGKPGKQAGDLGTPARGDGWPQLARDPVEDGAGRRPRRFNTRYLSRINEPARQRLQALDRVAIGAPSARIPLPPGEREGPARSAGG